MRRINDKQQFIKDCKNGLSTSQLASKWNISFATATSYKNTVIENEKKIANNIKKLPITFEIFEDLIIQKTGILDICQRFDIKQDLALEWLEMTKKGQYPETPHIAPKTASVAPAIASKASRPGDDEIDTLQIIEDDIKKAISLANDEVRQILIRTLIIMKTI